MGLYSGEVSHKKRQVAVDRFALRGDSAEGPRVALLSLKAAGAGLNLCGARPHACAAI
jgi:SNF2 family DNA or RNA helicase